MDFDTNSGFSAINSTMLNGAIHGNVEDRVPYPVPPNLAVVQTIRLLMQGKEVGSIIGKKGDHIKTVRDESMAKINISDGTCPERIVTITGSTQSINIAFKMICKKFEDDQFQIPENIPKPPITFRLIVPATQCGSIIGKGGSKIKDIREATGASIQVASEMLPNSTERAVTLSGTADAIIRCMNQICLILLESPPKGATVPYRPTQSLMSNLLCSGAPSIFPLNPKNTPASQPLLYGYLQSELAKTYPCHPFLQPFPTFNQTAMGPGMFPANLFGFANPETYYPNDLNLSNNELTNGLLKPNAKCTRNPGGSENDAGNNKGNCAQDLINLSQYLFLPQTNVEIGQLQQTISSQFPSIPGNLNANSLNGMDHQAALIPSPLVGQLPNNGLMQFVKMDPFLSTILNAQQVLSYYLPPMGSVAFQQVDKEPSKPAGTSNVVKHTPVAEKVSKRYSPY